VSKNSLGQYTGAVLFALFLLYPLSRLVHPGLWGRVLQVAGPPMALFFALGILENLVVAGLLTARGAPPSARDSLRRR
jgi:hypothetical protein